MRKRLTALAMFAHPDDESWMCAGTLMKLRSQGYRLVLVTLTRGERCTQLGPKKVSQSTMAKIRTRELHQAARIIGIEKVILDRLPDQGLQVRGPEFLTKLVLKHLKKERPNFILTFARDGVSRHNDHRAISTAVSAAVRQSPEIAAPLFFDYPAAIRRQLGLPKIRSRRLTSIDCQKFAKRKLRAIHAHRSQVKTLSRLASIPQSQQEQLFSREYVHTTKSLKVLDVKKT